MSRNTSQYAINDYIHIPGNYYIHEAKVIVVKNNYVIYDGILKVDARIDTNDSYINIIWDNEDEKRFYMQYNGKYDNTDVSFIDGKLIITAVDKKNEPISITIF